MRISRVKSAQAASVFATFPSFEEGLKIRSKGEPVNISRMEALGAHSAASAAAQAAAAAAAAAAASLGFSPSVLAQTRLDQRSQVGLDMRARKPVTAQLRSIGPHSRELH